METKRRGILLVISGPSGTGKGTLIEMLRAEDPSFDFSVSATTRAPRENEVDGVHYYFVTQEQFDRMVQEDAFLEHARVHDNRYGTLKSEVYGRIERGESVLLDIDVQGAINVMEKEPDCLAIFISPPSYEELRDRLIKRGTDEMDVIETRLTNARWEMTMRDRYHHEIVNDDRYEAYARLRAIVQAKKAEQPLLAE